MLFKKRSAEEDQFRAQVKQAKREVRRAYWDTSKRQDAWAAVESARSARLKLARCSVGSWGGDITLYPGMVVLGGEAQPVTPTLTVSVAAVEADLGYLKLADSGWSETFKVTNLKKAHQFEQALKMHARRLEAGEDQVPADLAEAQQSFWSARDAHDQALADAEAARDALIATGPSTS